MDAATPIPTGSLATLAFRPTTSGTYYITFYTDNTIVNISEIHGYETWTNATIG